MTGPHPVCSWCRRSGPGESLSDWQHICFRCGRVKRSGPIASRNYPFENETLRHELADWLVSREGISTAIKLVTLAGVAWGTLYLAVQRSEGHAPTAPIYVLPAPVQPSPALPPSTLDAGTR